MDKSIFIEVAKKVKENIAYYNGIGKLAEAQNLIIQYNGKNNAFYAATLNINVYDSWGIDQLKSIIEGFIAALENDLLSTVSYERKIKTEVVNDYLHEAEILLEDEKIHPAIPTMIIGISLEEFLRNWVSGELPEEYEDRGGISNFATKLKNKNFIDKQDIKDITSWAGLRNEAAHGKWENINNRDKIQLMLEGVNIFLKKYTK